MNVNKLLFGTLGITLAVGITFAWLLSGCSGSKDMEFSDEDTPENLSMKYLTEVHTVEASDLQSDSLLLYVDYSTCVAEAMNSKFFQDVQPTLSSNKPLYFSIKGNKIAREYGNTYDLLRSVKEVNNADLRTAANDIAAQDRQAVLITDAEYWHPGAGDNLNNPYMHEALGKWLSAGRDIYIYAEPYLESGKYNKFRYYIVFTDDRLAPENNINRKMESSISSLGDVKKIHLSARAPKAVITEIPVDDSEGIMLFEKDNTRDNFKKGVPMFVFENNIYEIAQALQNAGENKAGKPISLPLIAGVDLPVDANGIFDISDYDVNVYDLTSQAIKYTTPETDDEGNAIAKTATLDLKGSQMEDVFEVGEKELKDGKLALYFENDFIERDAEKGPSLLRVDIVADDASSQLDKSSPLYETLSWDSISKAAKGGRNNSFFESVKQAINNDKTINPSADGRNIIYTFYIFTEQ